VPVGLKQMIAEAKKSVREVSPQEVKEGLDRGAVELVIDVREPHEWQRSHMPGALNLPRGMLELKADPESPVADADLTGRAEAGIVVYCLKSPSARSLLAAETLGRMGYSNVTALSGGLNGWQEAGLPVETAT
jgi:rhodanese-related sulfurtransferase